jgi:hypothetical protein
LGFPVQHQDKGIYHLAMGSPPPEEVLVELTPPPTLREVI